MSLIVKDNSAGEFEPLPEGTYIARCFRMIDLGTQASEFNGEKKAQHKIVLTWEILDPETLMQNGQPFSVSKRYTASLNKKSQLFADLQAWRGMKFTDEDLEGFDLRKVLGAYCSIQVLHEVKGDRTYENITAIMFTREKPKPVNELVSFDLSEPDIKVFSSLSERLQETIKSSPEGSTLEAIELFEEKEAAATTVDDLLPAQQEEFSREPDEEVQAEIEKDKATTAANAASKWITTAQRKSILNLVDKLGADGVQERMEMVSMELGRDIKSLNVLTYDEANGVIGSLNDTVKARGVQA